MGSGVSQASVAAQAKLVAVWPEGKLPLCGTVTSGCGSAKWSGGRSRPIASRSAYAVMSATRSASVT